MIALYFPSNFILSNPVYRKLGVHMALVIGCVLTSACLWVRTLINWNFNLAMFGALFFGFAQPLILNANSEVATNWFGTNEVPRHAVHTPNREQQQWRWHRLPDRLEAVSDTSST